MKKTTPITELESQISLFYEGFSNKRLALATFLVGLVSIGSGLGAYMLFNHSYISIIFFVIVSIVMINLAMYLIVPPTTKLNASQQLLIDAVKDPDRVKSIERRHVTLIDRGGKSVKLSPMEQQVWDEMVVPFVMKHGSDLAPKKAASRSRNAERALTEQKERELAELEKTIQAENENLKAQAEKLKAEQTELASRANDLKQAENLVIDRFAEVEEAQAELEQMKENFEVQSTVKQHSEAGIDPEEVRKRDEAFRAKEQELKRLEANLAAERKIAEAQKLDYERRHQAVVDEYQLKADAVPADANEEGRVHLLKQRELELEARLKELDLAAEDIEGRYRDVEDAENTLIKRLNELSEREAKIEQDESGIESKAGLT
ncbi:MAG: hypothetical protein AAGC73_08260 [Verrucomicrobiota bacterium]